MRCVWLFILVVAAQVQAQVQEAATPFAGMACASSMFFSPWNVFGNPAGSSRLEANYAGVSYRRVFDLKELSTKSVFVVHPCSWGVTGLTYVHFGYDKYSEQQIGFSWGRQLSRFLDLGAKVDYLFSQVAKQTGIRQAVLFEIGLIFTLPYEIQVGIYTYNPVDVARLSAPGSLYVAERYSIGASWQIDHMFTVATQMDVLDAQAFFAAGVHFFYEGFLSIRCGFRSRYNSVYAGGGVKWNRYEIDLNYNTHPYLGAATSVCLAVRF